MENKVYKEILLLSSIIVLIGAIILIGAIFLVDNEIEDRDVIQDKGHQISLWKYSKMYTVVDEYLAEDHKYIAGVYDCTEMSNEIASRLRDIGYDAKKVTVVERSELHNYTTLHAVTEVVIWINTNGELMIPHDEWVNIGS